PFYFVTLYVTCFPSSKKFPCVSKQLWQRPDTTDDYLLTRTAIIFIIFTLVQTKLPHYTLPAFPLLALLLARRLAAEKATRFFRSCAFASASVYLAIALIVPPVVAGFFPVYQLLR